MKKVEVKMADVVIFGCGRLAETAEFYLRRFSDHKVSGFAVDKAFKNEDTFLDLPLVEWEELAKHFPPDQVELFAPVSYRGVNRLRQERFEQGKQWGYRFIAFIHPDAAYYDTPIGENCFVFENNTIQPFSAIGDNVILWSGNHVGHHSVIEDHCFVTSQVVISGGVRVGSRSFLGVNCTLRDNISIGKACVIGAGALVLSDLEDESVVPAEASKISTVPSSRLKYF